MTDTTWAETSGPATTDQDHELCGSFCECDPPAESADVLIGRLAPRALAVAEHLHELGQLSKDQLYGLLIDVRTLAAAVETIEEELIMMHRLAGASWAELGIALGTGRQAAKEKHNRIWQVHARGLNLREATAEEAEIHEER